MPQARRKSARRRQCAPQAASQFLGSKYKGDQTHDYLCAKAPASRSNAVLSELGMPRGSAAMESLRLPCIGTWLLRSPRRTVTWPLPPRCVSKVHPWRASNLLSSCAFMKCTLLHTSVEVYISVE